MGSDLVDELRIVFLCHHHGIQSFCIRRNHKNKLNCKSVLIFSP
ncbi:hypothetical protein NC653_000238 [Populus alba x Populus x berolinensis]|uniref:Uncharacterized protein n=1 Tax=Populus alba x Populus x berolinensis TaxID=444605 RepID=A0AAD6WEL8_9ROSI|nr:hypothetical protein NC653_000238 [Populus alba x Populus x berolinensis]